MKVITNKMIEMFKEYLQNEEKAQATVEKYVRDVVVFRQWLDGADVTKTVVLAYKQELVEKYAPASVNAALSSLNCFFNFVEWYDCRVRALKIQKSLFRNEEKELSKKEYERLLAVAKQRSNQQLYFLMQTICSTGIRVSELGFITMEAIKKGKAVIRCKGKTRIVFLPMELCRMLKGYAAERSIKTGPVFVTKTGKPLDRSNIWKMMKQLCKTANVSENKVFPHNLRHLFAITFYSVQKDIVRLADLLGHSNVNTTRIYTMETGEIHRLQMQKLGLLQHWFTT